MPVVSKPLPQEAKEAIAWVMRLSSENATDKDRKGLAEWLRQSPSNVEAWQTLSSSLTPFSLIERQQLRPGALAEGALKSGANRRTVLRLAGIGISGTVATFLTDRFVPLGDLTADHFTLTGERKTVILDDGSRMVLAPRTAVDVSFSTLTREIFLRDGKIMLAAPKEALDPIVLRSGAMTLQAQGGTFVVQTESDVVSMSAIDTDARITCGAGPLLALEAGHCLSFDGKTILKRPIDAKTEVSWVDGLLYVDSARLSSVVARLRPYFPGVIRLDPSIQDLLITGIFPLNDLDGAMSLIVKALDIDVRHVMPYWISMGPKVTRGI